MSKERETEQDRKARHRYEEAADLIPDSTRPLDLERPDLGYTPGIAWEDKARMALARPSRDRTDQDWEAIGRHENPRSGVTGQPGWEAHRGDTGS